VKFGKRGHEEGETIQLAPLIDIVFLTLVFFMTTSVYSTLERQMDIVLPTADTAERADRGPGEIIINLTADGRIILNDREVTLPQLQERLTRVAELFPGGAVIIRGDRKAVLGNAIAIMDCCRKVDIQNIRFGTLDAAETGGA
jgi:biopolymer transport protein ExbD